MKILQKRIIEKSSDYYNRHIRIINGIFHPACQMTNKEIEILASFMSLHKELTKDSLFNTQARKRVMADLNLIPAGLSHHIRNLRDKGHIFKDERLGVLKISDYLFPEDDVQNYKFQLVRGK